MGDPCVTCVGVTWLGVTAQNGPSGPCLPRDSQVRVMEDTVRPPVIGELFRAPQLPRRFLGACGTADGGAVCRAHTHVARLTSLSWAR